MKDATVETLKSIYKTLRDNSTYDHEFSLYHIDANTFSYVMGIIYGVTKTLGGEINVLDKTGQENT